MFLILRIFGDLIDGPRQGGAQSLVHYAAAGFADGCQPMESPIFRTAVAELAHQQTVRQHDQVHVPGLALAVAQLTVSHAQLLLAVAVKGFRAGPTLSIHAQNTMDLPTCAVGNQNLGRRTIATILPQDHDSYGMFYLRQADGRGEVPLPRVTDNLPIYVPG